MHRMILALLLLALAAGASGNIDLVTLPERSSVQLTIYNSEDLTLVKERRFVTVKRGPNRLQFSWANTLIDPTSVELRPLAHAGEIDLADTVFPGRKPQHLVWNLESRFEGQVPVEVSYFTSGLTWSMDYVATADAGEATMAFDGFVRVFNQSGEDYEDAEVRLIVGNVNLVEKIAELAQRRGIPQPEGAMREGLRKESARMSFAKAEEARDAAAAAPGEKGIVKEGLSEYFMFSVEGRETVAHGWSKRMRAVKAKGLPFAIVYRLREHQYGPRPVRFFVWRNDAEHELGESPLPDGRVRVFRENGRDGLSYLGEQVVRYVPVKAPIEVNLGPDDLVVHERRALGTDRIEFQFSRTGNREYVSGWDERTRWVDVVRNYRDRPIAFELRRQWPGHVGFLAELETTLFDFQTVETRFDVPAGGSRESVFTVVRHLGANAKQNRIELK